MRLFLHPERFAFPSKITDNAKHSINTKLVNFSVKISHIFNL